MLMNYSKQLINGKVDEYSLESCQSVAINKTVYCSNNNIIRFSNLSDNS